MVNITDYEQEAAEKILLMKLHEAEDAVKDSSMWLTLDEVKAAMEKV